MSLGGKGGWSVGVTTLPPTCADCPEILGASTYCNPHSLSRPYTNVLLDQKFLVCPWISTVLPWLKVDKVGKG